MIGNRLTSQVARLGLRLPALTAREKTRLEAVGVWKLRSSSRSPRRGDGSFIPVGFLPLKPYSRCINRPQANPTVSIQVMRMRRWWLAVLPLFWSCADNLPETPVETARLEALDYPDLLVAGWPEPLDFRVQAATPGEGEWSVVLRVEGPGLDGPQDYLLLDDGDYLELAEPGPGQASHSGDNVPGDGWFSLRLSADFSTGLGDFSLRALLLKDGVEVDAWQESRERLENRLPLLLSWEAPGSLASGADFTASLVGSDPDGAVDLASASLRQRGGVMRSWPFQRQNDSLFTVTVGPELAAGRQGPDTLTVELLDRVGHSVSQNLVVELENGPPSLAEESLVVYQILEDMSLVEIPFADTLHLYSPGTDPTQVHNYLFVIDASDPQSLADLSAVTWEIDPLDGSPDLPEHAMEDPTTSGRFQGQFQLAGVADGSYNDNHYRFILRAFDAFHDPALVERRIFIHNPGDAAPPSPPGRILGGPRPGRTHSAPVLGREDAL